MVVSSLHLTLEITFFMAGFVTRLLMITPFTSIAISATTAPRIEVYTTLACSIHRPDIFGESSQQLDILDFIQHSDDHGIPVVAHPSSSVDIKVHVSMTEKSLQTNDADTPPTRKQRCASDPVVQAAVAKLTSGAYKTVFFLSCASTST
jgi:hypothetical protein